MSIQQQGYPKNQRSYFVVSKKKKTILITAKNSVLISWFPKKNNVMILIPVKNSVISWFHSQKNVIILIPAEKQRVCFDGIPLILEETRFLNKYRPLFPVLQPDTSDFYRAKTTYDWFHAAMFKYMQKLDDGIRWTNSRSVQLFVEC